MSCSIHGKEYWLDKIGRTARPNRTDTKAMEDSKGAKVRPSEEPPQSGRNKSKHWLCYVFLRFVGAKTGGERPLFSHLYCGKCV